ncbi:Neurogenic locus Notch protein [Camponotus floridanus]|uniref:Neurogenic locus Notch protein n=1 Tax=Camponotus floridanus TaxID=104421 RepID=E1ZXI5_CAMFO|nr:Neurogenic locus Notch protein [Camponotus floridanus]
MRIISQHLENTPRWASFFFLPVDHYPPHIMWVNKCMCSSGYTGQNCESDYIPCDPSPCENGGSCQQVSELGYACHCPEGDNYNIKMYKINDFYMKVCSSSYTVDMKNLYELPYQLKASLLPLLNGYHLVSLSSCNGAAKNLQGEYCCDDLNESVSGFIRERTTGTRSLTTPLHNIAHQTPCRGSRRKDAGKRKEHRHGELTLFRHSAENQTRVYASRIDNDFGTDRDKLRDAAARKQEISGSTIFVASNRLKLNSDARRGCSSNTHNQRANVLFLALLLLLHLHLPPRHTLSSAQPTREEIKWKMIDVVNKNNFAWVSPWRASGHPMPAMVFGGEGPAVNLPLHFMSSSGLSVHLTIVTRQTDRNDRRSRLNSR